MFQKLLSLNPNDNQGVHTLAEEALFKLDRLEDALKIVEQYPNDIMPDTLYGRALALLKLRAARRGNCSTSASCRKFTSGRKRAFEGQASPTQDSKAR